VRASAFILAGAIALAPARLRAQRDFNAIPRPRLDSAADTNSSAEYLNRGMLLFRKNPKEARAAFYWASRLDPRAAAPIYSRYMAWLLDRGNARAYALRDKDLEQSGERKFVDSLVYAAMLRDPFVRIRVDKTLWGMSPRSPGRLNLSFDPSMNAMTYVMEGRNDEALIQYNKAIAQRPKSVGAYIGRANLFYYLQQYDSAAVDLARALAVISEQENEELIVLYRSKALLAYGQGHALLMAGDVPHAREAFGRALAEDLSFYMAHMRLGAIAAVDRDTATAIQEYETAIALRGNDPVVRHDFALMLMKIGKLDEAAEQFRKAIEAEPFFAAPYVLLAAIEAASGNEAEAKRLLEQFVARAARDDPTLERARQALAAMTPLQARK
jgi:tetratricopeptide (TPR) repeat protein